MKKLLLAISVLICASFSTTSGFCLDNKSLYDKFEGKAVVRVFVADVKNSTGENKIDASGLKKELEDALAARKSIHFKIVETSSDADIIIECDVSKYLWQEVDPIDMIMGTGAIVYDVVTSENYAYMEATFIVMDAQKSRVLWNKKLSIDLTKANMNQAESLPLINSKTAKVFIKECFGKKNR